MAAARQRVHRLDALEGGTSVNVNSYYWDGEDDECDVAALHNCGVVRCLLTALGVWQFGLGPQVYGCALMLMYTVSFIVTTHELITTVWGDASSLFRTIFI